MAAALTAKCSDASFSSQGSSYSSSSSVHTPLGPLAAFDQRDGRMVFFEEKKNRLVLITPSSSSPIHLPVPAEYSFEKFYWARIYFRDEHSLLCLVKQHETRQFHVLSIDVLERGCKVQAAIKTQIRSQGYQIASQRDGDLFHFSFTSRVEKAARIKPRRTSDRQLFKQQVECRLSCESSPAGSISRNASRESRSSVDTRSSTTSSNTSSDGKKMSHNESVMMLVDCTDAVPVVSVISLGKERLGVHLKRPSLRRSSIRTKYMTKLPSSGLCAPFLLRRRAVFVSRECPRVAVAIHTVDDPKKGMWAAIRSRLSPTPLTPSVHDIPLAGDAPSPYGTWSNFELVERVVHCVVQDPASHSLHLYTLSDGGEDELRLTWRRHPDALMPASHAFEQLFIRVHGGQLTVRGRSEDGQSVCTTFHTERERG